MLLIVGKKSPGGYVDLNMEQEITMPQRQGQVCRVLNPLQDENPEDVYLIVEDPEPYCPEDTVYAVNLKDL